MDRSILELQRMRAAEILGTDLARAQDGDLALVQGGFAIQSGEAVAMLDIAERLETTLGSEFYDRTFGAVLENWVEDEDTEINRLQMIMELRAAIQADPRVTDRSAQVEIVDWIQEPRLLKVSAGWIWITGEIAANLVIQSGEDGTRVVESFLPTPETEA